MRSSAGRRSLIAHLDDIGMCHGANRACLDLLGRSVVTCGSVMVPCPWFPGIAEAALERGDLDLGVHLTLTSEWRRYRWRPLIGTSPSTGLVDADGYMWRTVAELRTRMDPLAVEEELRAQIETAAAAGLDPTHLDTHMGAALLPELAEIHIRLGEEYRLPVVVPRELGPALRALRIDAEAERYAPWLARLEASRALFVDRMQVAPAVAGQAAAENAFRGLVGGLQPGTTFVSLHCCAPGDIEEIAPDRAEARITAWRLCAGGNLAAWIRDAGIRLEGFREFRERYRSGLEAAGDA